MSKRKPRWTYSSYIQSDKWQKKRQKRLEIDNHTCQGCGITQAQLSKLGLNGLQVHHKNGGPPDFRYLVPLGLESPEKHLLTLCPVCHDGITDSVRKQRYGEKARLELEPDNRERPPLPIINKPIPSLPLPNAQDNQNSAQGIKSDHTQRTISGPSQQIHQSPKGSDGQEEEDGRRSRRSGTAGVSGIMLYKWTRSGGSELRG